MWGEHEMDRMPMPVVRKQSEAEKAIVLLISGILGFLLIALIVGVASSAHTSYKISKEIEERQIQTAQEKCISDVIAKHRN